MVEGGPDAACGWPEAVSRFAPPNPEFAERVRDSFRRQPFMALLGARLGEVAPGRCEIRLRYRPELSQQHGYFHGGVIGTLADNACGYAGFTLAPADATILTVEYKLNIVAPGVGELLVGRGEVVRAGRTLVVCRADVVAVQDGSERLCATSLQTLMLLPGRPDAPP
jgi:uncharacterized protein (TIGR00369 family)